MNHPDLRPATVVDILRWRATYQSERTAYMFLADGESEAIGLTYGELDQRARAVAARLHELGVSGERALLLYPPGLEYITAVFGCLYAGVVAVPAYPPRPHRWDERLHAIAADSQAVLALTITSIASDQQGDLRIMHWLDTDSLADDSADDWQEQATNGDALALLQYTSGSTAMPKGVKVSHHNLMSNLASIQHSLALTPESRAVSWLPPYHDMGLIGGILQPLYTGFLATLFSPVDFVQRPVRWLRAITHTQATVSGGPNFAYEMCVRAITLEQCEGLDLGSWALACNGAELIRAETLERFATTFAPYGFRREAFYACYGLAEATLFVTGGSVKSTDPQRVSCGCPRPDQPVVIVDPNTQRECSPGETGEIWVAGPSVTQGYWNRPAETMLTFHARLVDSGEGPFLRTGDLGFVRNDELFVTGRLKDLIIIRGTNHYPQDIELTAEGSHPALRPGGGAAFAVDIDDEERLVVVHELKRQHRHVDGRAVAQAIRQAVAEAHALQVYAIVLLRPGGLPQTTSGKTQRYLCREKFLSGKLKAVYQWTQAATADTVAVARVAIEHGSSIKHETVIQEVINGHPTLEAVKAWLINQISQRLGIPGERINVREPFISYGLDSLTAVSLSGELENWLGRRLSPTLAWEYPSIEALARHLAQASSASSPVPTTTWCAPTEPIAIIGLACRFPGAPDPDAFWRLLRNGVDAITEIPPERWDVHDFYDPDPSVPGKMNTRWGGFLDQVDHFDARFFGISPREALRMDPQQRLLMELAWEALEDAGLSSEQLSGSPVGVFIGLSSNDYGAFQIDPALSDMYAGTGNAASIAANRLSYFLNLRGPSLMVDTACSSALTALHLACCSVWNGESSLALVGGANVILLPTITVHFTKAGMMSPDGRSQAFDARANGYVRGEGAGLVVLKPLARALADGDPIYAVIRGSAINQDGRSNGLTAPNPAAQTAVILEACQRARITPGQLTYVEAHGTGTALGDPIEALALGKALAVGRSPGQRCFIGSVKTNIGHLEAASGIAGLIKVALALKHREIPPSLHFHEPNPHIPFDELPLQVTRSLTPWPDASGPALAGVNSFGFGGANAHVVLQEAPRPVNVYQANRPKRPYLLPLSARSPEALRALAEAYQEFLIAATEESLYDVCHSACVRRDHHDHRLAMVGRSRAELLERLDAFLKGEARTGMTSGRKRPGRAPKLVFVFSGQGPQWWGMGRELLEHEPVFRRALEKCDELLRVHAHWSLLQELCTDESHSRLTDTEIAQPAIFALQVGLAALWQAWGIVPDAAVGHSVGEVAAAHVAGALSLEDAVRVIFERGRLMQPATGQGKMAAVELSPAEAREVLARYAGRLALAAINGPTSTVLSGDPEAVDEMLHALQERGIYGRLLPVRYAFHSYQMDPCCDALARALEGLGPRPSRLPIVSTLTGQLSKDSDFDAAYWARNVREPVLFADAIGHQAQAGHDLFLELSPHPVLTSAIVQCLPNATALPSLRRGDEERGVMLGSLGALYTLGYPVDWRRLYPDGGRCVRLPRYPWQRERYWLDMTEINVSWRKGGVTPLHPLLGKRLKSPHPAWQNRLDSRALKYLRDHRVQGVTLLPGAAYMEIALAAAAAVFGAGPATLTDMEIHQPLFLPEDAARILHVSLVPGPNGEYTLHIHSRADGADEAWTPHVTATLQPSLNRPAPTCEPIAREQLSPNAMAGSDFYLELQDKGFQYGPCFQGIEHLWRGEAEAWGLIRIPPAVETELERYHFHPAVLDACGQVLLAVAGQAGEAFVPVGADRIRVYGPPGPRLWSHARLRPHAEHAADVLEGDGRLLDEAGHMLVEVIGLRLQRAEYGGQGSLPQNPAEWLYVIEWQRQTLPASSTSTAYSLGKWLIFADEGGTGVALAAQLASHGERCVSVSPGESYARLDDEHFCIDPARFEDMQQLLGEVGQARGVVHLWSPDMSREAFAVNVRDQVQVLGCTSVLHLVQALAKSGWAELPRLWLITRGAQAVGDVAEPVSIAQSPLWGLGRTIPYEHPELHCTNVDLSLADSPEEIEALLREITSQSLENQIALRGTDRYLARLAPYALPASQAASPEADSAEKRLAVPRDQPFRLGLTKPGLLDNLILRPAPHRAPGPGEVEIRVKAAGLNFRDVMKAMGIYPTSADEPLWLGDECVGSVVALGQGVEGLRVGDDVLAVAPASFGAFATTRAEFVVPKPDELSYEQAATLPIAFVTAYYALHHLGQLSKGERVLIHAAAGGVGLAAVQVAQWLGAEIFATAGSPEKREHLLSLGVQHVMDSRSLSFADEVMTLTDGQGVDLVLNSLAGDAMRASLSVLGAYGRFLEIGKRDIYQDGKLSLRPFQKNLAFFSIDLAQLFRDRPTVTGTLLREVVGHIREGHFKALPTRVFPIAEAVSAFRHMAQARHIGKIALTMSGQGSAPESPTLFRPDSTYLITGGLGGLGLLIAEWMVSQGARHLALVSRSDPSPTAAETLEHLRQGGAQIRLVKADVAHAGQLADALAEITQSMPPPRGILHAAGLMDNDVLINLNPERFESVMRPKLDGAWNLHMQTQTMPLDFFVLFSSAASLLGSPRQANYAAANSALDALAQHRRRQGLPALSIQWGAWAGLGMAAHFDRDKRLSLRGLGSIPADKGLEVLGQLMWLALAGDGPAAVGVLPIHWAQWREFYPALDALPLFAAFVGERPRNARSYVRDELLAVEPAQRQVWLEGYIQQQVARAMRLSPLELDRHQPLNTLGLDSLMGIELKNRVEADLGVVFPIAAFLQGPSIAQVAAELFKQMPSVPKESSQ